MTEPPEPSPEELRRIRAGWRVSLRSFVNIRWEKWWRPRLIVHEKYEHSIKWTLRVLWVVGILSAVVSMGLVAGVAFALGLSLVEQFFERALFQYTTIVITPVPDFSISMDEITGMAYAWPEVPDPQAPNMAGFCFVTKDLAVKFFDLLRQWNYGADEDKDDNIKLTFVWPKKGDGYYVCLHPSMDRKGVKDRFDYWRQTRKEEKAGKEQQGLVVMWTMPPAATSKSSTCGRVKLLHPTGGGTMGQLRCRLTS